eukprot:36347_1
MGSGVDTNPSLDLVVVPHIANVLPPEEIACLKDLWIFGYGSLVWRPEFDHVEKRPARLEGYKRRFWQGSHDHRGTHTHPGRVVTLLPCSDSVTWGMAYRVGDSDREKVLSYLDVREKNGYSQVIVDINFPDECGSTQALVYIATECNVAYLGPAPVEQIADQIMKSHGPSGSNSEYLLNLAHALREIGADDSHTFSLEEIILTGRYTVRSRSVIDIIVKRRTGRSLRLHGYQ